MVYSGDLGGLNYLQNETISFPSQQLGKGAAEEIKKRQQEPYKILQFLEYQNKIFVFYKCMFFIYI